MSENKKLLIAGIVTILIMTLLAVVSACKEEPLKEKELIHQKKIVAEMAELERGDLVVMKNNRAYYVDLVVHSGDAPQDYQTRLRQFGVPGVDAQAKTNKYWAKDVHYTCKRVNMYCWYEAAKLFLPGPNK